MPRTKQPITPARNAASKTAYTRNNTRTTQVVARRSSIVAQAKAEVAARKAPRTWTDSQLALAVSVTLNVVAVAVWLA